jgi:hypothetical protein
VVLPRPISHLSPSSPSSLATRAKKNSIARSISVGDAPVDNSSHDTEMDNNGNNISKRSYSGDEKDGDGANRKISRA